MGVGLSILMGLKATGLFLCFAFLRTLGFTLLSIPFLYASLVSVLISIASHPSINLPILLGKNPDGSFPIWSIIMFSPYLYFVRFFSMLRRFFSGEEPYSEICEGVYVGGWPYSLDNLPPGNPAIIDCTCEFPRISELKGHSYFCVPTWDTRAPQPGEIESAVKWACRKRAQNRPIFVHCAYGMILDSQGCFHITCATTREFCWFLSALFIVCSAQMTCGLNYVILLYSGCWFDCVALDVSFC